MGHFVVSLCASQNESMFDSMHKKMCFTCVFIFMNIKLILIKIFCTSSRFEKKKKLQKETGNSEYGLFLPLYYVASKIFIALCGVFTPCTITLSFNLIHSRPHPQGLVFLFQQVVELVLGRLVVLSSQLLPAASCRTIHMRILTRSAPRKSL